MSYILDALKRADAQRTRGGVPGLHVRQLAPQAARAARRTHGRIWLAIAAALILGIGASWWAWRDASTPAPVTAVAPAVPVATAPAPPVQSAPVPAPPAQPAPTPAVAAARAVAPQPSPARAPAPVAAPAPAPAAVQRRAAASAPTALAHSATAAASATAVTAASAPTPSTAATPAPAPAMATSAAAAAPPRTASGPAPIPMLGELAEGIRRQIPALTITGAVYSANPAQRILIVNNQVLTQGTAAAPEVQLEEIRERSAVFSFRGTRFQVAH